MMMRTLAHDTRLIARSRPHWRVRELFGLGAMMVAVLLVLALKLEAFFALNPQMAREFAAPQAAIDSASAPAATSSGDGR